MTMLKRFQRALASFVDDKALGAFVEDGPSGMHAWSERRISATTKMTVRVRADVRLWDWDSPVGPRISLEGSIALDRLQARLVLRQAAGDGPEPQPDGGNDVALVPELERIPMPRSVGSAPMGADPFLWVRFVDGRGHPLSHEIYLGRSSREAVTVEAHLTVPVEAIVWLTATDCSHPQGPILDVSGELRYPAGVTAAFQFRNFKNPQGESFRSRTVDLSVLPARVGMPFRPQRVMAATGGSPWLSVRFMDVSGRLFGDEVPVGRCIQLPSASA